MKLKDITATVLFSTALVTTSAFAMDAETLKKQALEACETSTKQVPEAHREMALKSCKCTVEKTDYKAVLSGDTAKVQEDAMKNAQECAKEAGAM